MTNGPIGVKQKKVSISVNSLQGNRTNLLVQWLIRPLSFSSMATISTKQKACRKFVWLAEVIFKLSQFLRTMTYSRQRGIIRVVVQFFLSWLLLLTGVFCLGPLIEPPCSTRKWNLGSFPDALVLCNTLCFGSQQFFRNSDKEYSCLRVCLTRITVVEPPFSHLVVFGGLNGGIYL